MTNRLTHADVEALKSEGRYVHAGALAAALGENLAYGCHYGMRSTRDGAMAAFRDGFLWASTDMRSADLINSHVSVPVVAAIVANANEASDAQRR
jgi:hypothetical protein